MGNDNSKERNVNGGTGRTHSRSPAPHTQTRTAPSSPALGPTATTGVVGGGPSRTVSPPSSSKGTVSPASPATGTRAWWSGSRLHLPPLLEVLHLQNQGMRLRECRGMLRALADHRSVRVINLAGNPGIGNGGLELIAAMFAHDSFIEILDLSGCDVSDKGMSFLARAIASNPKLALVDVRLAFNRLTDASCAMLADCVKHNSTLMRIDCRNNPLITANGHYILQCMRSRPALVAAGKARFEPLLSPDPVSPRDSSAPQVQLTDAAFLNQRTAGGNQHPQHHSANSAHTSPSHPSQRLQHHHSHPTCDTYSSSSSSAPHAASSAAASSLAHSASPATFFSPSHSGLHDDSETFSAPSSPMSPLAICTGLANQQQQQQQQQQHHAALYASPSASPSASSAHFSGPNGSAPAFAAPMPTAPGAAPASRSRKALAKQAELASHWQSLSAELEAQLSVLRVQPLELVSAQLLDRVFLLLHRDDAQMSRFAELSVAFRQGVLPVSAFYTYALETLKFSGVRACAPAMIVALAGAPERQAQLQRAHVEYLCVKAMLAERRSEEHVQEQAQPQTQTQGQTQPLSRRPGSDRGTARCASSGTPGGSGAPDVLAPIEVAFSVVASSASPEAQTPCVRDLPEFPSEQASAASTPLPCSAGNMDSMPQFVTATPAQAQAQAQVHPAQNGAVTADRADPPVQSIAAEPLIAPAASHSNEGTARRKSSRAETPPQPQEDAPTSLVSAIAQPATAAPAAPANSAPAAPVAAPAFTPSPVPTPTSTPPPAPTPAEDAVDATSVHARFMQDKLARAAAAAAAKEEAQRKEAAAAEQKRLKEEAAAEARRLKEEALAQKKAAEAARRAEEAARKAEEARKKEEIAAAKRAAAEAERARREAEKAEKVEAARQAREAEEARKAAAIADAQRQEEERRQAFEAARRARLEAEEAESARAAAEALRQAELDRAAEVEAARKRARREAREAEKREAAAAAAAAEQEKAARISAADAAAATRKREKEAEKAARRREAEPASANAAAASSEPSERITLLEEAEALSRLDSERAAADAAEAKKRRKEEKKAKKAAKEAKEKEKEKERASAQSVPHAHAPPPPPPSAPPAYPSSFGNHWSAPSQQAAAELDVPAQVAAWAQRYTAQLPAIHLPPVPPAMPAAEGATASDKFIPYEEEVAMKRAEAAARARIAALHAAYAQAQADAAKRDRDQANIKADVAALLLNLHTIFPPLGEDGRPQLNRPYPFAESLQSDRSPAAIKKAFLKASVQVHPDKQAKSDAKRVQLSSCIFPILRDAYQHFANKL